MEGKISQKTRLVTIVVPVYEQPFEQNLDSKVESGPSSSKTLVLDPKLYDSVTEAEVLWCYKHDKVASCNYSL